MFGKDYIKEYKRNLLLAYPVLLGQAGHILTQLADNVMVGKLGSVNLAAAALGSVAFTLLLVFLLGITSAVTTMIGNQKGAQNIKGIQEIVSASIFCSLVLSIILGVIASLSGNFLYHLGQDISVVPLAIAYFKILCYSAVPLSLFFVLKHFTDGMELTKPGMVASLLGNLLNIGLNYILIYGKLGFKPLGLEGAGWATFIARFFMFAFLAVLIIKNKKLTAYLPTLQTNLLNWFWIRRLFYLGIPISMQYLLEAGAFILGGIMVGWLGAKALAAHQIALSLAALTFMMASGLGATATIRVSNIIGEEAFNELSKVGKSIFVLVLLFMLLMGSILWIFNVPIAQLFIQEPDVVLLASQLLLVAALFQIFDGIQVVAISALRGFSDVRIPTLIALLAYWIVSLPIGYYFVKYTQVGALGVWFGFLAGLALAAILLTTRFFALAKRETIKHEKLL